MGPVFEQVALREQTVERLGPVGLPPREEDHVMGAGDGRDAVDLDEAQTVDQRQQRLALGRAGGRLGKGVEMQEQPAGERVGEDHGRRPDQRPVSAAIWARLLRARSVADLSWPQAAMMSSPRGVRIGEA